MRTKVLSSSVSAFSRVSPPDCLRYGVAKPSVWPRRTGCNQRQFWDFRSDSPLNFSWFWFQSWNRRENLRVCKFLMPQWNAHSVPACTLRSWTTAGCFSGCFSRYFLCPTLRSKSCVNQHRVVTRFTDEFVISLWTLCWLFASLWPPEATPAEYQLTTLELVPY